MKTTIFEEPDKSYYSNNTYEHTSTARMCRVCMKSKTWHDCSICNKRVCNNCSLLYYDKDDLNGKLIDGITETVRSKYGKRFIDSVIRMYHEKHYDSPIILANTIDEEDVILLDIIAKKLLDKEKYNPYMDKILHGYYTKSDKEELFINVGVPKNKCCLNCYLKHNQNKELYITSHDLITNIKSKYPEIIDKELNGKLIMEEEFPDAFSVNTD